MGLFVWAVHWSDNRQEWGEPFPVTKDKNQLGHPFLYFLAVNQPTAQRIVEFLKAENITYGNFDKPKPLRDTPFFKGSCIINYKSE